MRVAHVVTLASATGAFGGPLTVAMCQAEELAARGHAVTVFAGWDGSSLPESPPNVELRLFKVKTLVRGAGFSGLMAFGLLMELARSLSSYDVIHVHLCRDLITSSSALLAKMSGRPFVLQTHGMVDVDTRFKSRVFDGLLIQRLLRHSATTLALTEQEERALNEVARGISTTRLTNGVKVRTDSVGAGIGPVKVPRVLFCARLHPRKRVLAFAEMAAEMLARGVEAEFVIAGPDGGDLGELKSLISQQGVSSRLRYLGALGPSGVRDALASSSVFVLPSVDEPFPMIVLEALAEGTPTVVTDSCHIGADLSTFGAVVVSQPTPSVLADNVSALLADPVRLSALRRAGFQAVNERYSIGQVVDQLERSYRSAVRPS